MAAICRGVVRRSGREIAPVSILGLVVAGLVAGVSVGVVAAPAVHDGESAPARAWRSAMERADLAALSRMYDRDSTVYPPDATVARGRDAIMDGYAKLFAAYRVDVAVADAHWIEQPPLVASWGTTTLTLHPKAGGPAKVSRTRFTDVAVPVDGGWRYLVDHASAPRAP